MYRFREQSPTKIAERNESDNSPSSDSFPNLIRIDVHNVHACALVCLCNTQHPT